MQVPVVMTTAQGQKVSTVTINSPTASSPVLTAGGTVAGTNSAGKVLLQTMPTLVPAQGQNGERITLQLITLPATAAKPGTPITVRTLAPFTGGQVLQLAMPTTTNASNTVTLPAEPSLTMQDLKVIKVESLAESTVAVQAITQS